MAVHGDYIPQKETALIDWVENFVKQTGQNAGAWQIPQAEVDNVQAKQEKFKGLHGDCAGPNRTKTLVAEKDAAKKSLIADIRVMVNFRFANPLITDPIRVQCGLHPKDRSRTPIGTPVTRPEFDLKVKDLRQIEAAFWDQGGTSRAKPYGMSGALISYGALDHAPGGPEDLTKAELATHTPYTLEFPEADRGKTVYIALQWQNESGKRGPWSEIRSAIIP